MLNLVRARARTPHGGDAAGARRAWATIAALFTVAVFAWGLAFYALGFYLRELHRLHGWSLASLSWVTLLFYVAATSCTFGVARVLRARGPKTVFTAGGLALGGGVLLVGQVQRPWQVVVAYLVLAVGWSCLSLYPISTVVLAWFPERNGPPLAMALTGASAGGMVVIPTLTALTERLGLRGALALSGAVTTAVVSLLAAAAIRAPATGRTGDVAMPAGSGTAWSLLRRRSFWVLLAALVTAFAVQVGLLVHQLSLLADHLDDVSASRIITVTTAAALGGRLTFMALSVRRSPAMLGVLYLLGQIAGLLVLGWSSARVGLTVGCALFGWGVGVLITIPPLLVRAAFADVAFTAAYPIVNVGLQLANASGAPITAAVHDAFGGYGPTTFVLAGLDAVAVALLLAATRPWARSASATFS